MKGYWRQPAESETLLEDGWLNTGDVAVMDSDGFFHIIGRSRDLIRAGEHTVYPRDVEELLYENNKVREVAVVGVPDQDWGERVCAALVARPGSLPEEDEVRLWCKARLAPYKVPKQVAQVTRLPRNAMGKVMKPALRSLFAEAD